MSSDSRPGLTPLRRVLIPPALSPASLRGRGSGLTVSRLEGTTMGTFWSVSCLLPEPVSPLQATAALEQVFALVIAQMSHWDGQSRLCQFNHAPAGTWQELPAEFYTVLAAAAAIAETSGGAFDPTLGDIVDLYGFGPSPPPAELPGEFQLHTAIRLGGWQKLKLDPARQAAFQPGGLRLDLSSIAKGYAVDLAAAALEQLGVFSYLVEIGGEVRGAGCKSGGEPWWCLLEPPAADAAQDSAAFPNQPMDPEFPETIVALCGLSVATSGDSIKQRRAGDRIIGHLIDPKTLQPTDRTLAAVSVFAADCMSADAWATALFTAGRETAMALAESRSLAALFTWRTAAGFEQTWTTALQAMME